ncbi:MAG: hypothetical protein V3U92_15180 [Cellulophaga sp.]
MFENLSYKKKFIVLMLLLVVLSLTAYKRSFRITIEAYKTLEMSREKLAEVNNSQHRIRGLKRDVEYLDNIIGKETASADVVQQEILNMFTEVNSDVVLVKLEEIHKAENEYFKIYTNRLVLSGSFKELLDANYYYERKFEFSRVVSLGFYIERERRTRRKKLFQQIIFQNYEKMP